MIDLDNHSDSDRTQAVKQIFNGITPHYDLMNRLLSARRDVSWRRFAVKRFPDGAGRLLDVATGTGDVALEAIRQYPELQVTGVDFVPRMLEFARRKTGKIAGSLPSSRPGGIKPDGNVTYLAGDALALPFPDDYFDASIIAFGLRNIPDRLSALREMTRVVRSGGKILVLEMTFPRSIGMRRFFTWYLNRIIPFFGRIIAGHAGAYRYLPDSIRDFLQPDELINIMKKAGLTQIQSFSLTFGITYLHEGIKA